MVRIGYDFEQFYKEKGKLPVPDGLHCIICGIKFEKPDKRKSYCTKECYQEWCNSLNIGNWETTRRQVLIRDGKCIDCGVTESQIEYNMDRDRNGFEVHHIVPISEGGNEFDINNCITLCVDCHIKRHNNIGKAMKKHYPLDKFV